MFFHRSIRFRFIAWYTSALIAVFVLFSAALYSYFQKSLKNKIDEFLSLKAEGIIESIDTYWEMEKLEAQSEGASSSRMLKLHNANFARVARRWVKESLSYPELMNVAVEIFDPDGSLLAASENLPSVSGLSREIIREVSLKDNYFYDYQAQSPREGVMPLRALACAVIEDGKTAYMVQVLMPVNQTQAALNRLKLILFTLLPVTILIAGILAGEFLSGVILRPLERISRAAGRITADNLDSRIELPPANDQIRHLAVTFNEMLEKLHNSFLAQKRFFQDVSHELRTPLTILKGELEVVLKKTRAPEEYASILKSNLEEINRISRITENLLLLARFDNNEVRLDKQPLSGVSLLRGALDEMDILIKGKSLRVETDLPEDLTLEADKEKMHRVFLNLLDNAVKYTPGSGLIKMTLLREGDKAVFTVFNSGDGISAENLPFVFDRFFREAKARDVSGFGLGLSIVKSIVKAHRGEVRVSSQPDKGVSFSVRLPMFSAKSD